MEEYIRQALEIVKAQASVRNMTEEEITSMVKSLANQLKELMEGGVYLDTPPFLYWEDCFLPGHVVDATCLEWRFHSSNYVWGSDGDCVCWEAELSPNIKIFIWGWGCPCPQNENFIEEAEYQLYSSINIPPRPIWEGDRPNGLGL